MKLKGKRVAIVGAGPAGLTIARLLQQAGASVQVYERDKNRFERVWGGTLDLYPESGQKALRKAGLAEEYFKLAIPMGRVLADERGEVFLTTEPNTDAPEINRNDLRTLLLNSLAVDTVMWDRKYTGLEERDGAWCLHFEGQENAFADVVIGANGGMSKLRRYVTASEAINTGSFIIQGEVQEPEIVCPDFLALCQEKIFMTSGSGITLVANPRNNGALTYGVTCCKPDAILTNGGLDFNDRAQVIQYLSRTFDGWSEHYLQLFRATSFFVGLPTKMNTLDSPWERPRPLPLTLIGDAAHLMPPFAGQGANIGLLDALYLAEHLTDSGTGSLDDAIADYEQKMFIYASAAQAETSRNEATMRSPDFSFKKRFLPED